MRGKGGPDTRGWSVFFHFVYYSGNVVRNPTPVLNPSHPAETEGTRVKFWSKGCDEERIVAPSTDPTRTKWNEIETEQNGTGEQGLVRGEGDWERAAGGSIPPPPTFFCYSARRVGSRGWWPPLLTDGAEDHSHHCHREDDSDGGVVGERCRVKERVRRRRCGLRATQCRREARRGHFCVRTLIFVVNVQVILGEYGLGIRSTIAPATKIHIKISYDDQTEFPKIIVTANPGLQNHQPGVGDIVLSQQYTYTELLVWWDIVLDSGV